MHDTKTLASLALALIDLVGAMNSPRQDDVLLAEAGVLLDRALFPLLVRIGGSNALNVASLAEQVGRDPSTVSRQIAKMEGLGLVKRRQGKTDQRQREAVITIKGRRIVQAITKARERLLAKLFDGWSLADVRALAHLNRRLADAMRDAAA